MPSRVLAVFVAVALAVSSTFASEQRRAGKALTVSDPVLAASLDRIASESRSWREALRTIATMGRQAIVVTADRVSGFDQNMLAQAVPVAGVGSRVETVTVVVNLELMQRLSALPVQAAAFQDDLDRILAHEVFGHAVPYLLAGHLAGECTDPAPGQRATDACSIQRENVVRMEMGLGRRLEYGRDSLTLARRRPY